MKNRSNSLLLELLIVIAFFMISATVLLQVFTAARKQSVRAENLAAAAAEAQNIADTLYAAPDAEEALRELGFADADGVWQREDSAWRTEVSCSLEESAAGVMRRTLVRVLSAEGEEWLSLPCSRFEEVRP